MRKLGRGELVRPQDRHHLLDAGVALEPEPLHVLAVADRADHGDLLAARRVRAGAHALDAGDDGLDVILGGRRLHHDHHVCTPGEGLAGNGTRAGAPALGPRAVKGAARAAPAERLAKSPGGIRVGTTERPEPGRESGAGGRRGHDREGRAYTSAASASTKRSFSACVPTVTRSAPSRPSDVPARTRIPRSARPRMTSGSERPSPRSNQTKLACEAAGSSPSSRRESSRPMRSARLRSTRRVTSSPWLSDSSAAAWAAALQKNGWRTWSTAVRKRSEPHRA